MTIAEKNPLPAAITFHSPGVGFGTTNRRIDSNWWYSTPGAEADSSCPDGVTSVASWSHWTETAKYALSIVVSIGTVISYVSPLS